MGNALNALGFDTIPLDSDILFLFTKDNIPSDLYI